MRTAFQSKAVIATIGIARAAACGRSQEDRKNQQTVSYEGP